MPGKHCGSPSKVVHRLAPCETQEEEVLGKLDLRGEHRKRN